MRTAHSKMLLALLGALATVGTARAQTYRSHLEHPIAKYKMSAQLYPEMKTVRGHYTLTWWNHTGDAIRELYFHLYLNAFKNADSTFMREGRIGLPSARRHELELKPDEWGWENVDKILVNGADMTGARAFVHPDDDNAMDQTVMRIILPQPVAPHGTAEIAVDFTSRLPKAVARSGYEGDYYLVAQWFPKIGVYEEAGERGRKTGGWNCHQYHANTEFYADYGVYDVELTVPSKYVVGSTGFRRGEQRNLDGTATYHQYQEDVHDFAWTASPSFTRITRTFDWGKEVPREELAHWAQVLNRPLDQVALRNVDVTFLLRPGHLNVADRYFRAVFNAMKYFGLWYGQYPYDTMTVVDTPRDSATCCMEYPTFITVTTSFWPGARGAEPEFVTVHEFGHQFWYALVGNNEFEEAWLDEGFNMYSDGKVLETAYSPPCAYERVLGIPVAASPWLQLKLPAFPFAKLGEIPIGPYFSCMGYPQRTIGRSAYLNEVKDDDLVRLGWQYLNRASYSINSYPRPALTLRTLESYLGQTTMARVMRTYHERWRYRHPCTQDFVKVVNEVSGRNMDWFFQQFFYGSNLADYEISEITTIPIKGKVGIYDEDGKMVTHPADATEKVFAKSKEKRYRSIVTVRRLGEAVAPVDVVVRFDNGETIRERWDGRYRWVRYEYEKSAQVTAAEVDPERRLALEANFTNNSYQTGEDNRGAAKWYVRWIFWLENLYFAAGFFS